jgi:hypothetical protein
MNHLDDAAFERLLVGRPVSLEDRQHLDHCLACRRELEVVRHALSEEREELVHDKPDWNAQRRAILDRIPASSVIPMPRPPRRARHLMAAAATLLVALGVGWLVRPGGEIAPQSAAEPVPVEEILATTDTLLADDDIPGFGLIDPFADSEVDFDLLLDGESS